MANLTPIVDYMVFWIEACEPRTQFLFCGCIGIDMFAKASGGLNAALGWKVSWQKECRENQQNDGVVGNCQISTLQK
jgi:hypothetical protein